MITGPKGQPVALFLHGESWYVVCCTASLLQLIHRSSGRRLLSLDREKEVPLLKVWVWDEQRVVLLWCDFSLTVLDLANLDAQSFEKPSFCEQTLDASFDPTEDVVTFHGRTHRARYALDDSGLVELEIWPEMACDLFPGSVSRAVLLCEGGHVRRVITTVKLRADDIDEFQVDNNLCSGPFGLSGFEPVTPFLVPRLD
jgi:hypothetical protein